MLKDYEVIEGICGDCCFYGGCSSNDYNSLCVKLLAHCEIFKKKEVWETCTRENTKIGDTVEGCPDQLHEVKYIHECYEDFLLGDDCLLRNMSLYKIKVG